MSISVLKFRFRHVQFLFPLLLGICRFLVLSIYRSIYRYLGNYPSFFSVSLAFGSIAGILNFTFILIASPPCDILALTLFIAASVFDALVPLFIITKITCPLSLRCFIVAKISFLMSLHCDFVLFFALSASSLSLQRFFIAAIYSLKFLRYFVINVTPFLI